MILKVKSGLPEIEWRYFEFNSVSVSEVFKETMGDFNSRVYREQDTITFDINGDPDLEIFYYEAYCKGDTSFTVVFNSVAYLINDAGNTIDIYDPYKKKRYGKPTK